MTTLFPKLFTPVRIGGLEIKNRILSTGHDTTIPTDGTVNEALIAYHEARARGGAGLICLQVAGVHDTARYSSHILMLDTDRAIDGYARLAERLHSHGTKVFAQVFHPGREIMESSDGTAMVAWAPSVSPSERYHVIPRAMTVSMITEVVDGYAAAAGRAKRAGIDGVEFVASHGYLPAQFLNPKINRREDDYGGALDNRLRFFREVLDAMRDAAGPDFVIGMRISGDEKDPEGLTEDQTLDAIDALETRLDYVSVIAGTSASLGGATHIVPPMAIGNAYVAPFAALVKARASIPVLVAGRINQPHEAERVVASGQADMCGMTRAMICDPDIARKAEAGRVDDIRACIGCNQACIGHFHKGYPISCIQHPETGRELTYGAPSPATSPKKVMVVGGGPGGMKAAAIAALRGHQVTLHEAAAQLGGQALLAQMLPGRSEFGGIVTNLTREMELADVDVRLNSEVDTGLIEAERPDAVIVATGGRPFMPPGLELGDDAHVVDAWGVLRDQVNVGASVVIADWRSDWIGMGLAQLLAESGCHVRLAVNGLHAGELMPWYVRDMAAAKLHELGVETIPYVRLYGADGETVYLQHTASEAPILIEGVDTLVLAQGHEPVSGLLEELEGSGAEIIGIGDCLAPRTAEEAVFEGLKAGWSV